jgi:hypothetical protein
MNEAVIRNRKQIKAKKLRDNKNSHNVLANKT